MVRVTYVATWNIDEIGCKYMLYAVMLHGLQFEHYKVYRPKITRFTVPTLHGLQFQHYKVYRSNITRFTSPTLQGLQVQRNTICISCNLSKYAILPC